LELIEPDTDLVFAGLVPAIHEHLRGRCSWVAGTLAGHDEYGIYSIRTGSKV
jgi:hypothetical protein